MDIALYIAELLHQYNEVNIAGLGTFFKERVNGFYDETNHIFVPPTRNLAFKLEHHESLILANYCCAQRNISQTTAIYFIEKFVKSVWAELDASGYVDLKALGILKKTDAGYVLEAKKENDEYTYYGLKPISENSINHHSQLIDEPTPNTYAPIEADISQYAQQGDIARQIAQQETVPHHTIVPIEPEEQHTQQPKQEQSVAKEILQPEAITPQPFSAPLEQTKDPSLVIDEQDTPSEEKRMPLTETILAFISLLLLVVIGIYYFYPNMYEHFVKLFPHKQQIQNPTSPKAELLADSTIKVSHIDTLQEREANLTKQHDTVKTNGTNTQALAKDSTHFEIIVATFAKQSEAENYVSHLKQKGVIVKILDHAPGSRARVSYASFTNRQIAETELIQIQKDVNPDAWIAIINPKKP